MNFSSRIMSLIFLVGVTFVVATNRGVPFQDEPALPKPEFQVETRGPIHEAFAQPNEGKVEMGVPIAKEPPPPLPERPPLQRPDNPNLEWIPGYWSWDAERNDFVWVTGTFRDPPPGRRWLPGHWANTDKGWSWTPGFWVGENQQELQYTPAPPAALNDGPLAAAPDANSYYVPGYWAYNDAEQRFAWRPGYWAPYRDGRVWVNPQYYGTPNGYMFADGYWDYPLADRGMLFAPAYFPTPLWNNPGWFYQPNYAIGIGAFLNSGFYRPGFNHYYYGNYYGHNYAGQGYRPWWGGTHNSLYNYTNWQHRTNPQWAAQNQQRFHDRMTGKAAAPTTTATALNHFTPQQGKLVPNTNVTAHNFQIRQTHDLANLRTQADTKAAGTSNLHLPPAPPHLRSPGSLPSSIGGANSGTRSLGAHALGQSAVGSINPGAGRIPSPTIINHNVHQGPGNITTPHITSPAATPFHPGMSLS
ncbi:MAG: hypothetical protein WCL32_00285, partial [Planctomycetota bacterium]